MQFNSLFSKIVLCVTLLGGILGSFALPATAMAHGGGDHHHTQHNQNDFSTTGGGLDNNHLRYPPVILPNGDRETTDLANFCEDQHWGLAHYLDFYNPDSWECGDINMDPDYVCYWAYGSGFHRHLTRPDAYGWECRR